MKILVINCGSSSLKFSLFEIKKQSAEKLAAIVNCSTDELVITRNTTESLDTIIGGFPWQAGDEAIMARQDYGAMINMFKQVERRHGIKRVVIDVPMHPQSDEEVVAAYEAAITKNTKLLMVCHLVNITGHILPIRKICDMAHAKGVEVMVDGAHAFAQIEVDMKALDCDYYGTSLHKWMSVPLGAGFLYVKKTKIAQIWPMFAEEDLKPDDITR
jgi:selenocysteine lyase/cysteine desulfurase